MSRIVKKVWPSKFFEAIVSGEKKFDLRLADWKCKKGDTLVFKEWDPKKKKFTGRQVEKKVTFVAVFKLDKLYWSKQEIEKHGFQVISLG